MGYLSLKCAGVVVLCSLLVSIQALPVRNPKPYPPVKCQRATGRTLQSFPNSSQKSLTQTWSRVAGMETESAQFIVIGSDFEWSLKDVEEMKVCSGVGEWTAGLPRNAVVRVPLHAVIAEAGEKPWEAHMLLLLMIASEDLGGQVQGYHGNLSVACSCDGTDTLCWDITIETKQHVVEPLYLPGTLRLSRRNAVGTRHSSMQRGESPSGTPTPLVAMLVVGVVGVVALVAILALCAGGPTNTYEPQLQSVRVVPLKDPREITKADTVTVAVQLDSQNNFVRNGALEPKQNVDKQHEAVPAEGQTSPSSETDVTDSSSRNRGISPESEQSRIRSLSTRSQDPLPEIPALDTAEENKQEGTKEAESSDKENNGDEDDPYSYARFREGGDQMEGSESEEEEKSEESPEAVDSKPPYGKVMQHPNQGELKRSVPETESYTEVREVFRGPQAVNARIRSATDPLEPSTIPNDVRNMRAYTESAAHLPLPEIPNMQVEGESIVYDSIPEDANTGENSKVKTKPSRQRKERVYESVDDMGGPEDTYETVPDDIKPHNSPTTPTLPLVSIPLPPRSPSLPKPNIAPHPQVPASPIPNKKGKEKELKEKEKKVEKRELTKTVSEADSKKRSFSFFGARKKTSSMSAGAGKTRRERDQHEPLPDVPSPISPLHLSPPPPPNIPAPLPPDIDEDQDTMYDQPQLNVVRPKSESPIKRISLEQAKVKSQSLPSTMRSAGANVFSPRANLPLPELPEDSSGSGTITVVRNRKESFDEDYDIVHLNADNDNVDDEPGYDTVNREEILGSLAENPEGADPGYDKVGKSANREEEVVEDEDEDAAAVGNGEPTDMRYAKVTKPSSPVEEMGVPPDHDEEGYAVVPEEIKLRKRAMSASKGTQQKLLIPVGTEPGYESVKHPETEPGNQQLDEPGYKSVKMSEEGQPPSEGGISPTSPTSPRVLSADVDEQYATVDFAAKRASQRHRQEQYRVEIDIKESASSPNPPPVPPIVDLGDMEDEFHEPPIPAQSEGVHELVETEHGYARIQKPSDHPYSQVDVLSDPPYARVMKQRKDVDHVDDGDVLSDPPYARVKKQQKDVDHVDDDAVGYDKVGGKASDEGVKGDGRSTTTKSKIEQDMPTLEPADPTLAQEDVTLPPQNIYDSLLPVLGQENGVEENGVEEMS